MKTMINKKEIETMGNYTKASEKFVHDFNTTVFLMQEGTFELVDGVANILLSIRTLYDATKQNKRSMREAYKEVRDSVRWFASEMFNVKSNAKIGVFNIFVDGLPSTAKNHEEAEHLIYLIMYQLKDMVRFSADLEVGSMTHEERVAFETPMAYVYETSAWWGVTETGLVDNPWEVDGFDDFYNPFKKGVE